MTATGQKKFVSPRDLASAIDASESSLKRWADEGLLQVSRTAGGHRRIPIQEAIRFVRDAKLRLVDPAKIGFSGLGPTAPGDPAPDAEDLGALFREFRGAEAARRVVQAYLAGIALPELCDGSLRGGLASVGDLYRDDDEGIAIEHSAVDACLLALNTIRQMMPLPEDDAPVALGSASAGDPYVLPSLSVALVLGELGYRAINVGPNMPFQALVPTIRRERPALVWRSFSIDVPRSELDRELGCLSEVASVSGCDVIIGGRTHPSASRVLPGVHHFDSLEQLSGFARGVFAARRPRGAVAV